MSSQSQRFAAKVLAGFEAAGHATDQEVGAAGGPSTTTMTKLRKAAAGEIEMSEPRNDTFRRIEVAAAWAPGSARNLWAKGEAPRPRGITGLAAALGATGSQAPGVAVGEVDDFLGQMQARITELEERLDLLEARLRPQLAAVAHEEETLIESEQGDDSP